MKLKHWMRMTGVGAIGCAAMLATPSDTNSASAAKSVIVPIGFPIAGCGTVGYADSWLNSDGSGEGVCLAWFSDSDGAAYIMSGLDNFQPGDRLHVEGLVCNICLTTCWASAIFDAVITPCGPSMFDTVQPDSKN